MTEKTFLVRLINIDRRILFFILIGLQVIILIRPLGLPVVIEPMVRSAYDTIESIPDDAIVPVVVDLDPGSWGETKPANVAVMKHLIKRNLKLVMFSIHQEAPPLVTELLDAVQPQLDQYGYEYGKDYVYVGFFSGLASAILGLAESWDEMVTADAYGTPASDLPILEGIQTIDDFYKEGTVVIGGCLTGSLWVPHWCSTHGGKLVYSPNAKCAIGLVQYYVMGHVRGIIPGIIGGAQYEALTGALGEATKQNDMISASVLICLGYLLVGNIAYFGTKGGNKK
ncbi:MAG: hypothetical protein ACFFDT_04485 [Candidatus Hodarchaeota archaeon]